MEIIIQTVRDAVSIKNGFFEEEDNVFAYTREFHCLPFTCYLQVNEALHLIQYRAYFTFTLRGEDEVRFREYIQQVNYRCPVGSFAYSREKDEFRYKNALAFGSERPTRNAIDTLIDISEAALDEDILGLIRAHNGEPVENA